MSPRSIGAALLAALGLTGCGVGQGAGEQSTEALIQAIALAQTEYLVLDLATGGLTTTTQVSDLGTNPTYRDQVMVFKAIDAGLAVQGSAASDFGHQADETASAGSVPRYYIGVFEVTQAQWVRLAGSGSTPWTAITPASLTTVDGTRPAHGISLTLAQTMVGTASARLGHGLSLPSDAQWERACHGGLSATFAWGESRDETVAESFARVAETVSGQTGPFPVGRLAANGYGLYDVHGNVWELTTTGALRGGSWRDSLSQARCANRNTGVDQQTAYGLAGLRLVLTP